MVYRSRLARLGRTAQRHLGEDSLQSLSLAIEMVHRRLASLVQAGDQLLDSEGNEFPFEAYFDI